MPEPLDLLAIMAHPDDAELLCGGTLIRAGQKGYRTGVVDLTGGESGTWGSAEVRADESAQAAEILGLTVRRTAGLPDAALRNTPEARSVVAGLIREYRPRVVVLPWIVGRHPDHRAAAELGHDSAFLAGVGGFEAPGRPHRPFKIVHALTFREDAPKPTFVVDVTDVMDAKIEALSCYASQFGGKSGIGEVYPGGERPLPEQVRVQCAHYGSLIRAEYGEPFWTRETMAVEDIVSLGVSTF